MSANGYDVWGYDPMVQRRYAEFVLRSQGDSPDNANMYALYQRPSPALSLLRCACIFKINGDFYDAFYIPKDRQLPLGSPVEATTLAQPMPHALLLYRYRIMKPSRALIDTVTDDNFPRSSVVVLEQAPAIKPSAGSTPGLASAVWKDSDTLEVDAQTATPGIVMITDPYSRYWRASALPNSAQGSYQIMPGDWALMAVPVSAGTHRFLLHYCPTWFPIGAVISIVALIGFLSVCLVVLRPTAARR
jgi:hypothetical protein